MSNLTDEQMIQVRINTAVDEALSSRDKEWEEKIESFWNGNYGYYVIPVREWELLKSQMKEGK